MDKQLAQIKISFEARNKQIRITKFLIKTKINLIFIILSNDDSNLVNRN